MPATVGHVLSATTPDDPSFEIQPKHWNSNHAVTLNVSATEISGLFSNENGVSWGTTDGKITASVQTNYAGVGETVGTTAGTDLALTVNTDGVNIAYPKWITTARASNDAVGLNTAQTNVTWTVNSAGISFNAGGYAGTGFTSTTTAGTEIEATNNTAGLSMAVPAFLTTARASNDAVGLNTALTANGVSWTVNSSGISLNVPAFLTTAALSNHSHGNPTLALTNLSGTTDSNSAGFTLSLAAADPGGAGPAQSFYMWPDEIQNSSGWQVSGSTSHVQPVYLPYAMSISYVRLPLTLSCIGSMASVATAANATRGMTVSSTINVGVYSQGTGLSSRSLVQVASGSGTWIQRATVQAAGVGSNWSTGHTISYPFEGGNTHFTSSAAATVTNVTMQSSQLTNFTNLRYIDIPFATSLAAGAYWFMYGSSTSISTSGTANYSTLRILASNIVATQVNQAVNLMGAATNSSNHFRQGLGSWTTNAIGGITASIALANISTSGSNPIMVFQMIRQA